MIRYDNCPLCHSERIIKVLSAKDFTVSGEHYEIWQCASCSLRFTQDVPALEEIGKYYKSAEYISHTETSRGLVNWLYLKVRRYTLNSKKRLVEQVTGIRNGALLDVGAGTGAFTHTMKTAGWQVEGLEPDSGAISKAKELYGLDLKNPSELFAFEDNRFDVITLWHVLEHVHDLHGYIPQFKKLIKQGGRLLIAVPNYTSFDAEHYAGCWAAYDVPRHLYHFSPASMNRLMELHGGSVERIEPMWFDSFYVSLLSEKYRSGSSDLLKGFWNGFRSNSRAFSNRRKTSSIIYVIHFNR